MNRSFRRVPFFCSQYVYLYIMPGLLRRSTRAACPLPNRLASIQHEASCGRPTTGGGRSFQRESAGKERAECGQVGSQRSVLFSLQVRKRLYWDKLTSKANHSPQRTLIDPIYNREDIETKKLCSRTGKGGKKNLRQRSAQISLASKTALARLDRRPLRRMISTIISPLLGVRSKPPTVSSAPLERLQYQMRYLI